MQNTFIAIGPCIPTMIVGAHVCDRIALIPRVSLGVMTLCIAAYSCYGIGNISVPLVTKSLIGFGFAAICPSIWDRKVRTTLL